MSLTRFCGVFCPRRPELAKSADLERMLAAFLPLPGAQSVSFFDPARGIGIAALNAPYFGSQLDAGNWLEDSNGVVAFDGWVAREDASNIEGPAGASAISAALREGSPLEALAGEFAFAAWDAAGNTLRLANDPQGRRSLCYFYDKASGLLLFASEARSILEHPLVSRQPDVEGLALFLNDGYIPAPYTGFEGIRKLRTGEMLTLAPDGPPSLAIHWRYPSGGDDTMSIDDWAAVVASTFRRGFSAALAGYDRTGLFFSAGLDSTILAGLVQRETTLALRAYTAGPPPETRSNELDFPHARRLAGLWGIDQQELLLTPENVRPYLLPVFSQFDEPTESASDAVTFALILDAARRDEFGICLTGYASGAFGLSSVGRTAAREGITSPELEGRVLQLAAAGRYFSAERRERLLAVPAPDVEQLMYESASPLWDANPSSAIEDRTSGSFRWARRRGIMFASAEYLQAMQPVRFRHPFGDWPSFRLGAVIPPRFRGLDDPTAPREVLERAFADIVPAFVYQRKKRGLPGYVLSDHTFEGLERRLFSEAAIEQTGLFSFKYVQKAIAKKQFRKVILLYLIWHELHINRNLDLFEEAATLQ